MLSLVSLVMLLKIDSSLQVLEIDWKGFEGVKKIWLFTSRNWLKELLVVAMVSDLSKMGLGLLG